MSNTNWDNWKRIWPVSKLILLSLFDSELLQDQAVRVGATGLFLFFIKLGSDMQQHSSRSLVWSIVSAEYIRVRYWCLKYVGYSWILISITNLGLLEVFFIWIYLLYVHFQILSYSSPSTILSGKNNVSDWKQMVWNVVSALVSLFWIKGWLLPGFMIYR